MFSQQADLPATGSLALTNRETEVLRLIAEENSTKEIAQLLGITFRTVATHRGHVMDKLAVHNVAGLVRYAIRVGLVQA